MNTEATAVRSMHVTPEKLLTLVREMIGWDAGREGDEQPLPSGPWDPVIRIALERIGLLGPRPDPWKDLDTGYPALAEETIGCRRAT